MSRVRNLALVGGIAAFAVIGGVVTQARETSSDCSNPFYMSLVHDEMRAELKAESEYLEALREGASHPDVSAEDQAIYQQAIDRIETAIDETEIVGRMKHPNNEKLQNCHLSLSFSDIVSDLDLGQKTVMGFAVDRKFEIIARFEIRFGELTGIDLKKNIERERNQFLVNTIEAGELVETAQIANLTRRAFDITEPEFVKINYATSFKAEETIEGGFFGKK